jgi:ribosome maturation factor RimP
MVAPLSTVARRVRAVVEPVVSSSGLVLEDVGVSSAGRRQIVRVVVDLGGDAVGGVDSDALAEVSRAVSGALDAADPIRGGYVLEVSTPGTDRPLTEVRHFRRARTRLVRLELSNGDAVRGRLVDADAAEVVVVHEESGARVAVPIRDVIRGRVVVELSGPREEEGV